MALSKQNPWQRCWAYLVRDGALPAGESGFENVIYVGKAIDTRRRWKRHETFASGAPLLNRYAGAKSYKMKYERITEGGLDAGFPLCRSDEIEAFFIAKYKTLHDPARNPRGCNAKNGEKIHELPLDWYERLQAELDEGYVWPVQPAEEPEHVVEARGGKLVGRRDVAGHAVVLNEVVE